MTFREYDLGQKYYVYAPQVALTGIQTHDLEVMSSNPGQIELGVCSTSVLSHTLT